MLVNAQGADMDVHRNFKDEFGGSFFSSGNMAMGSVEDFLLRYGLQGKHVRLEEYCIQPEYPIFVLGTLCENSSRWDITPERHIARRRRRLKSSHRRFLQMFSGSMSVQTRMSAMAVPAMTGMNVSSATRSLEPQAASPANSAWSDVSMDEVHRPAAAAPVLAAASLSSGPAAAIKRQLADKCVAAADYAAGGRFASRCTAARSLGQFRIQSKRASGHQQGRIRRSFHNFVRKPARTDSRARMEIRRLHLGRPGAYGSLRLPSFAHIRMAVIDQRRFRP